MQDDPEKKMQLLKTLKSSKSQRRMIIGFEASKNMNSNFLRKLDRMISVSGHPKSKIPSHVENVKYAPGEGIKQLSKALHSLND